MKHFDPLDRRVDKGDIEPLIKVLESLLGKEKVAASLADGDRKFEEALASRKPFIPIPPPTGDNEPIARNGKNERSTKSEQATPATEQAAANSTIPDEGSKRGSNNTDNMPSPQPGTSKVPSKVQDAAEASVGQPSPTTIDFGLPKDKQKAIHALFHDDRVTPHKMRWLCADSLELERLTTGKYWEHRGIVGYGSVDRREGTVPLWRFLNESIGRHQYFLNKPSNAQQQKEGLLAWVWTEPRPNMVEVFVIEDRGGNMQLVRSPEKRDRLINEHDWRPRFTFYLYPQASD